MSFKSRAIIVKVIFHVFNKIDPFSGGTPLKSFFTYRGPPKLSSKSYTPSPVESVNISGPFRCSTFVVDKSFGGGLAFFLAPDSTGGGVSDFDKSFGGPRIVDSPPSTSGGHVGGHAHETRGAGRIAERPTPAGHQTTISYVMRHALSAQPMDGTPV